MQFPSVSFSKRWMFENICVIRPISHSSKEMDNCLENPLLVDYLYKTCMKKNTFFLAPAVNSQQDSVQPVPPFPSWPFQDKLNGLTCHPLTLDIQLPSCSIQVHLQMCLIDPAFKVPVLCRSDSGNLLRTSVVQQQPVCLVRYGLMR